LTPPTALLARQARRGGAGALRQPVGADLDQAGLPLLQRADAVAEAVGLLLQLGQARAGGGAVHGGGHLGRLAVEGLSAGAAVAGRPADLPVAAEEDGAGTGEEVADG
jgi:hypothetical protein